MNCRHTQQQKEKALADLCPLCQAEVILNIESERQGIVKELTAAQKKVDEAIRAVEELQKQVG